MYLVVGLGNPGREYERTRHNVGWEVLDVLATQLGWIRAAGEFEGAARRQFEGWTLSGTLESIGEKVMLLKPTTYMNNSGRSVAAAASFYQVEPSRLMVVLDDLALPCGKIRIRASGSSGGHNGLKDIERALGTNAYPRLRVGIDSPPAPMRGKDYVLGAFTASQRELIEPAAERAAGAVMSWMEKGIEKAMNLYNPSADGEASKGE
jgi:PTH1 family peptidyl-tRNA hydrolase